MNLNHIEDTVTTSRRKRKRGALDFPVFLDARGRECHRLPFTKGPDVLVLKEEFDIIRPYLTSGNFFWNDDNKRGEDGELLRYYPKTTARIPGQRGNKKKNKTGRPTLPRLIWLARMQALGVKGPLKGWEVAYIDLAKREDVRPENVRIRPRWENKHWLAAVRAFDEDFDPATAFDAPCPILAAVENEAKS